jgi:uncharacterized protein
MTVTRYDYIELKADVSKEGWIKDRPIVTRAGIFEYRTVDGKVKREFRPESEVFASDSLNSLAGVPITDGHRGIIDRNNASGIIGAVLSPGVKEDQNVAAEIIIHDANKLGKKRELSLGYTCETKDVPGEWNGQRYDCEQYNIRYNHLAVVTKGRAGNARLRLDSVDAVNGYFERETDMSDNTSKLVTIRLDEIDYPAAPEVANALKKAKEDTVALQKRFDALEADRDSFKTKLEDAIKLVADTKASARSEIKARLELETIAKNYSVKCDESDSDRSVREKILTKLNPSLRFDGKSDDYVDSAFEIALTYEADKNKKVTNQMHRMDKRDSKSADNNVPAAVTAREQMIMRMRGEKIEDDKSAA